MARPDPPSARPLRRDAQRNRDRIVATARQLFSERGLSVGLDEIAHTAEVGVGTVYRHFPTKDALVQELFYEFIDSLGIYAETALFDSDGWTAFVGFVERLMEATEENRALHEVFAAAARSEGGLAAAVARLESPVGKIIDEAKAQGKLAPDFDGNDLGVIHSMLAAVIREHAENDGAWRRYLRLILDGLAAEARRSRNRSQKLTRREGATQVNPARQRR